MFAHANAADRFPYYGLDRVAQGPNRFDGEPSGSRFLPGKGTAVEQQHGAAAGGQVISRATAGRTGSYDDYVPSLHQGLLALAGLTRTLSNIFAQSVGCSSSHVVVSI